MLVGSISETEEKEEEEEEEEQQQQQQQQQQQHCRIGSFVYSPTASPIAMFCNAEAKHRSILTSMPYEILRIYIKSSCDMKVQSYQRRYHANQQTRHC